MSFDAGSKLPLSTSLTDPGSSRREDSEKFLGVINGVFLRLPTDMHEANLIRTEGVALIVGLQVTRLVHDSKVSLTRSY
jgi:hypothetical protein